MKSLSSFVCESFEENNSQYINENDCAVNRCADPSFSDDPDAFADEVEGYLSELEESINEDVIKKVFHVSDDKIQTYLDIAMEVVADIRGVVDSIRDDEDEVSEYAIETLASYIDPKSERLDSILDFTDFEEKDVKEVFKKWNKLVKVATGKEWVDIKALQKDLGIKL